MRRQSGPPGPQRERRHWEGLASGPPHLNVPFFCQLLPTRASRMGQGDRTCQGPGPTWSKPSTEFVGDSMPLSPQDAAQLPSEPTGPHGSAIMAFH